MKKHGPQIVLEWKDGYIKEYYGVSIRGAKHEGKRPARLYVSEKVLNDTNTHTSTLAMTLDPVENDFYPYQLYLPLDKYIIQKGTLTRLYSHKFTEEVYYHLDDLNTVSYEEAIDGPTLSKEEALDKYPEMFV